MRNFAQRLDKYIYLMLLGTVAVIPLCQEFTCFCVIATFFATLFVDWQLKKTHPAILESWQQKLLYALIAISIVSLAFSGNRLISIGNWFYVIGQYIALVFVLLRYGRQTERGEEGVAALLARPSIAAYRDLPRPLQLLGAFLLTSVLVSAFGIAQKVLGISAEGIWVDPDQFPDLKIRIYSTMRNPNILAGYLVLVISYAVAIFDTYKKERRLRLGMLVIGLLAALCLIYTYSRGNWLACALMLVGFCLLFNRKGFIPVSLGGILTLLVGGNAVIQRLSSISASGEDTSIALRIAYLESTMAIIEDFPLGVGWHGYRFVYPDYNFYLDDTSVIMYHCHNIFLNIWSELGPHGLLVFLVIWGVFLYNAWSLAYKAEEGWRRVLGRGYILASLGILGGAFTDHIYFNSQMGLLFWIFGILVLLGKNTVYKIQK